MTGGVVGMTGEAVGMTGGVVGMAGVRCRNDRSSCFFHSEWCVAWGSLRERLAQRAACAASLAGGFASQAGTMGFLRMTDAVAVLSVTGFYSRGGSYEQATTQKAEDQH